MHKRLLRHNKTTLEDSSAFSESRSAAPPNGTRRAVRWKARTHTHTHTKQQQRSDAGLHHPSFHHSTEKQTLMWHSYTSLARGVVRLQGKHGQRQQRNTQGGKKEAEIHIKKNASEEKRASITSRVADSQSEVRSHRASWLAGYTRTLPIMHARAKRGHEGHTTPFCLADSLSKRLLRVDAWEKTYETSLLDTADVAQMPKPTCVLSVSPLCRVCGSLVVVSPEALQTKRKRSHVHLHNRQRLRHGEKQGRAIPEHVHA